VESASERGSRPIILIVALGAQWRLFTRRNFSLIKDDVRIHEHRSSIEKSQQEYLTPCKAAGRYSTEIPANDFLIWSLSVKKKSITEWLYGGWSAKLVAAWSARADHTQNHRLRLGASIDAPAAPTPPVGHTTVGAVTAAA
jgi:hypothetical protein